MNPALVVQAGKSESVINYKTVIPFEPWMKDARFVLIPNMCGCGKEEQGALLVMADKVLTRPDKRYEVQPTLAYISPEAETVKHRAEVGTAYLDFRWENMRSCGSVMRWNWRRSTIRYGRKR